MGLRPHGAGTEHECTGGKSAQYAGNGTGRPRAAQPRAHRKKRRRKSFARSRRCQRRLHPARDRRCLRGSRGRRKIYTSRLYPENRGKRQDAALRAFRRARPRLFGRYGSAYDRHDADCSKRRNGEKTFRSSLSRRRKDGYKRERRRQHERMDDRLHGTSYGRSLDGERRQFSDRYNGRRPALPLRHAAEQKAVRTRRAARIHPASLRNGMLHRHDRIRERPYRAARRSGSAARNDGARTFQEKFCSEGKQRYLYRAARSSYRILKRRGDLY